ncbi:MAG: twin-arginine translocation signal domain-containing protein, partial [Sideroxydans sp.]
MASLAFPGYHVSPMSNRRDFLRTAAGALAATALPNPLASAQQPAAPLRFVGIQMGPHTMLDEGIEPCLDLIRDTAGVNAVFTYSHAFHADLRKPAEFLAPDHGKPVRANRSPLPSVWVKHHDQYF